jgi:ABC-type Fe3+-hydroxamate transport system substrate-binding protein
MLVDMLARPVPLASRPQRIVSLVPSLTEYLFAIGAGARVVGVTDFCTAPAEQVACLPHVRGTKNPDRERIIALQPDLVLASKEENRLRDVEALAAAGIPVYVTDICSVAGALEQLTTLAHILGMPDMEPGAAPLLADLRAMLHESESRLHASVQPVWRVLAFIWRDPWMAVGHDTYAADLLRLCGASNLALSLPGRYPRAALEDFLQLNPDVILLPDEPYRFTTADLDVFASFPEVAAVRSGSIHLCDGTLLTWYGPRSSAALRFLGQLAAQAAHTDTEA